MPCVQVILTHRFTCGERKIWKNINKSQNIMKMIVGAEILNFNVRQFSVMKIQ